MLVRIEFCKELGEELTNCSKGFYTFDFFLDLREIWASEPLQTWASSSSLRMEVKALLIAKMSLT